jgi:cell division transport system permease protein
MNLRRFDLPLDQTAASRFLPWILAGLVYLAVVALAVAAIADGALRLYGLRAKLVTVTLPAVQETEAGDRDVQAVLDILRATRGVTSARPVPPGELAKLIEPWLGTARAALDLPMPRLIDVTLDPGAKPDLSALQVEIDRAVPGGTIGIEALSRDRAERLAAFFRAWSGAVGVVALLGALGVAVLLTRLTLRMQSQIVELLRSMGAPDTYVARQFERHALLSSLQGGVTGFALGALTVVALIYSSRAMELAGSVQLGLRPLDWLLLACVPVISALLVTALTRMTALWGLARMA